jgi:hypothetical protein
LTAPQSGPRNLPDERIEWLCPACGVPIAERAWSNPYARARAYEAAWTRAEAESTRLRSRVEEQAKTLREARKVLMLNAHTTRPCQCDPICAAVDAIDAALGDQP